jgi:hypothetical protein
VASLAELDHYRWSGHAVLLGNLSFSRQDTSSILERFGDTLATAQQNYRQFVADAITEGRRNELVGGGLKRSQGEHEDNEYHSFDERILGGGDLVDELKQHAQLQSKMHGAVTLARLLEVASGLWCLDPDAVRRPSKTRAPTAARGIICHLAIFDSVIGGAKSAGFCTLAHQVSALRQGGGRRY